MRSEALNGVMLPFKDALSNAAAEGMEKAELYRDDMVALVFSYTDGEITLAEFTRAGEALVSAVELDGLAAATELRNGISMETVIRVGIKALITVAAAL